MLEVISVRLELSTSTAPPFYALFFVNVHKEQMKMDYVVANIAPPYVFASFDSKVISVPVYILSFIMVTPAPTSAVFCA